MAYYSPIVLNVYFRLTRLLVQKKGTPLPFDVLSHGVGMAFLLSTLFLYTENTKVVVYNKYYPSVAKSHV